MTYNEALDSSDTALLVAVTRRHRPALEELYRRHGDAVYAAAGAVCGRQQAEEVTRQVFVRLWWGQDRVECDRPSLRSHLVLQAYRRAKELCEDGPGAANDGHQTSRIPDRLSDREGLAVVLSRFGGGTYREVARLLGVSEAKTRRAVRSGLRRLEGVPVGAGR